MQVSEDKSDLPAGERLKNKKRLKGLKSRLKFMMTLMLLGAAAVLLAVSPAFDLKTMEVSGNKHYDSETFMDASGISIGSNGFKAISSDISGILKLKFTEAERNIMKSCPYVKSVDVRYILPSKVKITVVEREPACIVPYLGTNLLIDREGYVIDTAAEDRKTHLPSIKGIQFENYELGSKLEAENPASVEKVISLMEIIGESDSKSSWKLTGLIEWIDVSEEDKVLLFVDSRLVVNLGDFQDLRYRVETLKHIFFKNMKKHEKGLLDFTEANHPILKYESGEENK